MPLLIPYDTAGLDPKARMVIDDIVARIEVWAGKVDTGINQITPEFSAYKSTASTLLGGTSVINFDKEVFDALGNFSSSTFTAPIAGNYLFVLTVSTSTGSAAATTRGMTISTTQRKGVILGQIDTGIGTLVMSGSVVLPMNAGDTATGQLTVGGVATVTLDATYTTFSGRLLK